MILNTTTFQFKLFTSMQRLATKGEPIYHQHVRTIEEFEVIFEKLKDVSMVIVDEKEFVLVNDILNYVTCPVVTLGIEAIVDTDEVNFLEYDTEDI